MNGVKKIKIYQVKKDVLRISLENKKNLHTIYQIHKNQIIIKVLNLKKTKPKAVISNVIKNQYFSKNKIIVLDPGHGGKDSGAVGPYKRYEKNTILKISTYLYKLLKKDGYKVYLTRNKDKFINLKTRTSYANKRKADLFISIHANATVKKRAKKVMGIETFFLSPARSERAKKIAAKENKSDIRKMNYSSKNSLLTILNQSKITASNKLAIDVQQNILYNLRNKYNKIVDGGVREGPFWVLVGAQMPAILIEVGYVSNPLESKRLFNTTYQKLMAEGISNGINSYFAKNP